MRKVKVNSLAAPVDAGSPVVRDTLYTVVLGNSIRVRFTSERRALEFQAETSRFLGDVLLRCNLLLSEAFVAWRMAWPYLDADSEQAKRTGGDVIGSRVMDAVKAMDLATKRTGNADYVYHQWKHLASCAYAARDVAMALERLYALKTHAVPRHHMQQLTKQASAVLDELTHYGTDVATAHSVDLGSRVYRV